MVAITLAAAILTQVTISAGASLSAPVAAALGARKPPSHISSSTYSSASTPTAPAPQPWRKQMDSLHTYAPASPGGQGIGLNVRDFGATGAGVCTEAPDRSWIKCVGPDDSTALQSAIDEAMHSGRALYLPAGVYMVNRTIIVRKPSENATIARPQPYVDAGLRIVGEGMARTSIVAQCVGGAGCMDAVVRYEGNDVEPDLKGVTAGHSMESLSISAAGLATHGIHGPAIIWSRWFRVGVFASLGAGMRLNFGFCLRVEECSIGSNPGANLIGLHATADVNNLDVINSFFHGSHQYGAIVISGGMQVNIEGNVIEGFGGPAIVVNSVTGLVISGNYFEGDDENAWQWTTAGESGGSITTCSDIVLNGHAPDPATPNCNAADCWINSTGYLHALGNDERYLTSGAVISGNFHQPGSLVQVNAKCQNAMSSILASGVNGLLVAAESAINAAPTIAPVSSGGDPAGVALVASGTDKRTWTARNVRITSSAGYSKNNELVLIPDCPLCTDVEFGSKSRILGESLRDYGFPSRNQSLWQALPRQQGRGGGGLPLSALPAVTQLPAAESYEQQPTFEWRMPPPSQRPLETNGSVSFQQLGALALDRLDLALNPSLAAVSVGPTHALNPATIVVEVAAKLSYSACTLHFLTGTSAAGWNASLSVNTSSVGNNGGGWGEHSFTTRLPAYEGGTLSVGLALRFGTEGSAVPPPPGTLLATMAGFSVRRLGAPRQ